MLTFEVSSVTRTGSVLRTIPVLHHDRDDLVRNYFEQRLMVTEPEKNSRSLDLLLHFYNRLRHYDDPPLNSLVTVRLQSLEKLSGNWFPFVYTPMGSDVFATPINLDAGKSSGVPVIKEAAIPCSDQLYYGLTLENHSHYDLFPYVFYFNPTKSHPQV